MTKRIRMIGGLLLLLVLSACQEKQEAVGEPEPKPSGHEDGIVTIERFIPAGDPRPLGQSKSSGDLAAFREAYQQADRVTAEEALEAPDYEVSLKQGSQEDAWRLWVGAPGQRGMLMDMADPSANYRTTVEDNEALGEIILRIPYGSQQAAQNGDLVEEPSGFIHLDKWHTFLKRVEQQQPASIQLTRFTDEGDPIFYNIDYDGSRFHYLLDTLLDGWGTPERKQDTCQWLASQPTPNASPENSTTYNLDGCERSAGGQNESFSLKVSNTDLKANADVEQEEGSLADPEHTVTVRRSISQAVQPNPPVYGQLTHEGALREFQEAYSTAAPILADLDTGPADYEVEFPVYGEVKSLSLWLGERAKFGMMRDTAESNAPYLKLTAGATEKLRKRIMDLHYSLERAVENGDVVDRVGGLVNEDIWQAFREKVDSGSSASVQVVDYTIEGDPVFHNLDYDGSVIHYQYDNTHDAFGTAGRRMDICKKLVERPMEEAPGTKIGLEECSGEKGGRNQWFILRFPTKPAGP
ncbi:hypothetical protein B9G55_06260 [Saccharibacillus sp. O16]|nr:hypothetical protein B9G55_06260 [Saccharibacillus sp. O16]